MANLEAILVILVILMVTPVLIPVLILLVDQTRQRMEARRR
jgi:hypothetical protein